MWGRNEHVVCVEKCGKAKRFRIRNATRGFDAKIRNNDDDDLDSDGQGQRGSVDGGGKSRGGGGGGGVERFKFLVGLMMVAVIYFTERYLLVLLIVFGVLMSPKSRVLEESLLFVTNLGVHLENVY